MSTHPKQKAYAHLLFSSHRNMSSRSTLAQYLIARENIITQIAVFYLILSFLNHFSYVGTLRVDYLYNTQWF